MRLKMLAGLSGPSILLVPGDEADFPDDEALRLVDAGFAVPISRQIIERAVKKPPAEKRKGKSHG